MHDEEELDAWRPSCATRPRDFPDSAAPRRMDTGAMPSRRELQPLQRRRLQGWDAVAVRAAAALGLIALAFALLWFDRDGLRDNIDGHLTLGDVLYFTMITVSTVGYGDIVPVSERARLIDAFFITPIRIFLWLIFLGTAAEFLFKRSWENWRMRRIQQTLHDHIVLAGFGRTGQKALDELISAGTDTDKVVVIDQNSEAIEVAKAAGVAAIHGDATYENVQRAVHMERAASLIVSCGPDDTAVLTVLKARHLAPNLRIAVAIRSSENEDLAHDAGADVVVNPVSFAGVLLASTSHGEHLADYLTDLATARGSVGLREREVTEDEVGQFLKDVSGGKAMRLYRGKEVICPSDPGPPRVELGDLIIELVPTRQA
jgi:voltage-gated potassium channel